MKNTLLLRKIVLANVLIFSSVGEICAVEDETNDDFLHIGVSALVGGVGQYYLQDWRYSMATCLSIGVAKELYDKVDNKDFGKRDFALDAAGCALGVLATSYFWPSDSPNKLSFSMRDDETSLQYNYLF